MSSRGSEDLERDLLSARDRDLTPILSAGVASLELGPERALRMEGFLELAWHSGARTGGRLAATEAEFRDLMEQSADSFNLTLGDTIDLWRFLAEAWMAGAKTSEAEMAATVIESRHDVAGEALAWLAGRE